MKTFAQHIKEADDLHDRATKLIEEAREVGGAAGLSMCDLAQMMKGDAREKIELAKLALQQESAQ